MAGSSSDRPILEVLPNNSKRIFSGDFTGIAQRGVRVLLNHQCKGLCSARCTSVPSFTFSLDAQE